MKNRTAIIAATALLLAGTLETGSAQQNAVAPPQELKVNVALVWGERANDRQTVALPALTNTYTCRPHHSGPYRRTLPLQNQGSQMVCMPC